VKLNTLLFCLFFVSNLIDIRDANSQTGHMNKRPMKRRTPVPSVLCEGSSVGPSPGLISGQDFFMMFQNELVILDVRNT